VTTNTTLFDGADPNSVRNFFDEMMEVGVESMMVSPGYSYDKAPDQKHFMGRARIRRLFRAMLSNRKKTWRFNQSPLFLEYLMGKRNYKCTPWGMPTYNIFGWQKPCYLLQDGYAESYKELMETTEWASYGTESGNPQCANCMVHCGYEPSSVTIRSGRCADSPTRSRRPSRSIPTKMRSAISIASAPGALLQSAGAD
jgi:hopanoid biosynthesis associated radical SAM protein HpnH